MCALAGYAVYVPPNRQTDPELALQPTQPTTAAERRVIRWFFSLAGGIAVAYLAFVWWSKTEACSEQCVLRGSTAGELRLNDGGRFNLGSHCEFVQ